jgi:hypothetical protein
MDIPTLRRILTAFADTPADVDLGKGTILVQIRDDVIEAEIVNRHGSLYVRELGEEMSAPQWVIQRIARLPILAERILSFVANEPHFVTPGGTLLDQLDESPLDEEKKVGDAADCTMQILARRPAGTASVLYLTSDAGEGKTTLISQLARTQAQLYKDKESDWLLVPVSLGGRTFMRFDDVIIGALVNRLRFPFLYYEAFIELVRLGVVVPAFDGFEEMFVEGSAGDAFSALGNLMNTLQSSGTVLIAARKAYFEYKNLHSQARLFDSFGGQSVSFARLELERWNRCQFLQYATKRGISNAEVIYNDVADKLSGDHPLLTRAVLVKRLLDVAVETTDRSRLLSNIETNPDDYFRQFIGTIIGREAKEKWINKVGTPAHPLISEQDHYELLSMIALEMWTNGTQALRGDVLCCVAEVFADSKKLDKEITGQVIERVTQHALLVEAEGKRFAFDHQEFFYFFLGEAVGRLLVEANKGGVGHCFRQGVLPALSIEAAAKHVRREKNDIPSIVRMVNDLCIGEPRASFIKDNLGGILIRLMDYNNASRVTVAQGSFPPDSLLCRHLENVVFEDCYFQRTSLASAKLAKVRFTRCEIESLELRQGVSIDQSILDNSTCNSVVPLNSETAVYDPRQVIQALTQAGFVFTQPPPVPSTSAVASDQEMVIIERMVRAFMRSTGVNENTLTKRLGAQAAEFFSDVLPHLEEAGILTDVKFTGAGTQRRFRLGISLERLNRAIEGCSGNFDRFLGLARE